MLNNIIICVGWFAGLRRSNPFPKPIKLNSPFPWKSCMLAFPSVIHFNQTTAKRSVHHPLLLIHPPAGKTDVLSSPVVGVEGVERVKRPPLWVSLNRKRERTHLLPCCEPAEACMASHVSRIQAVWTEGWSDVGEPTTCQRSPCSKT